ncbi:DEAD/DEAH box helicase [Legionella nagasakiensis]|uniref:DEAD/DEAH box helicase n=1 Tax=Legionella nagasakiensis TaxID=535290 RepID=UPI00105504BC|nr:DEAD/DEAH box helicase [Legionella nagasakiensis]
MTQELTTFASLGLSTILLRALDDLQFVTPSPIQQQTIPWLLQGRDLVGLAQTGTGKTAAFALPILQCLATHQLETQALIIAPTRELAIQVAEHFESLSAHQCGIRVVVLCGGQDYRPQLKKLREGAQIVVGTPGRVLDHLERGTLQLANLKTFVLDEADEMLRMGFIEDVETILAKLPAKKQMALFSATMPTRIRHIASRYLNDPVSVEIRTETATVKSIEQRFLFASQHQKPGALLRVLAVEDHQGVIVFVRTKSSADEIAEFLQQHGHHAMAIHGDLTQALRERIIAQFKQGAIDILVATDVAARGLDVERVTHVINYDIAHDCETYVHRIGRTGRAGRSGVTILFVTPKESRTLNILERHIRQRIEKIKVPTDEMIQAVRQQRFLSKISVRLHHEHLSDYYRVIEDFIKKHDVSAVDVAAVLALLLNHDKPWQSELSLPKLEQQEHGAKRKPVEFRSERKTSKSEKGRRRSNDEYTQELFRLDVGKAHGVKPGNIVGAIANEAGLQSRFITGLKIHDYYSTVRLPSGMPKEVMHELNKAWVCGRQLKLTSLGMD